LSCVPKGALFLILVLCFSMRLFNSGLRCEKHEDQEVQGSKEERSAAYRVREHRTDEADAEIRRSSCFAASANGSLRLPSARVDERFEKKHHNRGVFYWLKEALNYQKPKVILIRVLFIRIIHMFSHKTCSQL
jgi:hypothetical protein